MRRILGLWLVSVLSLGCEGPKGDNGAAGMNGTNGTSCTLTQNADGSKTITCADGSVMITDGKDAEPCTVSENDDGTTTVTCGDQMVVIEDGVDGEPCTAVDNGDGTKTITCADGTTVTVNDGRPGLDEGVTPGLVVNMAVAAPAGDYFAEGDQVVVTITLGDIFGFPVELADLSRANLYMYGPGGVRETTTASALLNTTTDRSAQVHHYVNLKTTTNENLVVDGNVLTYTMAAITDEAPGTYNIGFWAVRADDGLAQSVNLETVQIGTADEVEEIIDGCGDCHQGAASGKMYFYHTDPGSSPTGNWALDSVPVRSCKMCHNMEGYAAYRSCSDGSRPVDGACPEGTTLERIADPIVRRVHGVHRGVGLANPFNTDPDVGDFKDWTHLVFPANIKNCTKCHADDSWKQKPSPTACLSCHDNVSTADGTNHGGGEQPDDSCTFCHGADTGLSPISVRHAISPPAFPNIVELSITPPDNGTHYVDESPVVTIIVKDADGDEIDPDAITESSFKRANLFVSGPRSRRKPVLTTSAQGAAQARARVTSTAQPTGSGWDFSEATDLSLSVDGNSVTAAVALGTFADIEKVTAAEVATWLNGIDSFADLATASADSSNKVTIKSDTRGASSSVEISASALGTDLRALMGWPTTAAVATAGTYANNDFRVRADPLDEDPMLSRESTNEITYQLDSVEGLDPGTYTIWVEAGSGYPVGWAMLQIQVGTEEEEKFLATNCADCHEDSRMHASFFGINFNPDICGSCHDYERQIPGKVGWASAGSNMGFGAAPLARRVHGVHFGRYLDKPAQVHASYDYSEVIFPQDVRNCTKCHSETDAWKQEPSRLACNACHDSDAAIGHTALMTYDPTPDDAWSGDELESCDVCHGPGRDFAPDVMHNVWDPYRPPYVREPE